MYLASKLQKIEKRDLERHAYWTEEFFELWKVVFWDGKLWLGKS